MRTTRSRHMRNRSSSVKRLSQLSQLKPISLHPGADTDAADGMASTSVASAAAFPETRQSLRRFGLLCARSVRQWLRDPSLLTTQLALVLLMAGLIGGFANDLPRDFTGVQTRVFLFNFMVLFFSLLGMSSIGTLVQERHVFARERASGFYSTGLSYFNTLVCDMLLLRVLP